MNNRDTTIQIAVIITIGLCVISAVALILGLNIVIDRSEYDRIPAILTSGLGVIGPTILGLLALLRAQRVQNDLRNGVLTERVKEGAKAAIEETGVVLRDGPTVAAQLGALNALLQQNTQTVQRNTDVHEEKDNGR